MFDTHALTRVFYGGRTQDKIRYKIQFYLKSGMTQSIKIQAEQLFSDSTRNTHRLREGVSPAIYVI